MSEITVIGGGLAGLTAGITAAEGGADVQLFEAHSELGGRARSTDGSYKANLGPHAIYAGGWCFGVSANCGDFSQLPDWPQRRTWGKHCDYSETLEIDVPDDAKLIPPRRDKE